MVGFRAWKPARVRPHDAANESHVSPTFAAKESWQETVWRALRAAAESSCGKRPRRKRDLEYMVVFLGCRVCSGDQGHKRGQSEKRPEKTSRFRSRLCGVVGWEVERWEVERNRHLVLLSSQVVNLSSTSQQQLMLG